MKQSKLKIIISALIILNIASNAIGQTNWKVISDVGVYSSIGLDTIDSLKQDNKKKALECQALRLGINNGVNQLVKHFVHKTRPDGSDNKSFYSSHTSNAMVSSGWNYSIGISVGTLVGFSRIKAKKHDWIDVSVGMGSGLLSQLACDKS